MSTVNLDWALAYAAEGFAVLPVWWKTEAGLCACSKGSACDRPAKHPIPVSGIKQATTSAERIRSWWEEHPHANVAVATGQISRCIVIDVDTGSGGEGDVAITTACADMGGVPRTLTAASGSGGRHYFYRWRTNPFTRKIGFLKHVDYLADGGYVIVQPSVNMKGAYRWDEELGVDAPEAIEKLRHSMAELPEWFDSLEGSGRAGRKADTKEQRAAAQRSRLVNSVSMEFRGDDARWLEVLRAALSHCDPDSRDDWVLFGIIIGRECQRSEDGWAIYNEWASRSAKYSDKGTQSSMRKFYYDESNNMPQGGEPASIATIFRRAQESGWEVPPQGVDNRRIVGYREGRAVETVQHLLQLMARERESDSDLPLRVYAFGSGLGGIIESHDFGAIYKDNAPPHGWPLKVLPHSPMSIGSRLTHTATIMAISPGGNRRQIECPREISTLMLTDYAKHFPRLNGVVQWPMVIGKKVVGTDEHYNADAGLVFALPPGMDLSKVVGTRKAAEEGWRWIKDEALAEFPFKSAHAWATVLAMALTFVQRRAIASAPAFLVTAPAIGSGKTSLVMFLSSIIHGRTLAARPLSGVVEEQRKTITSTLLSNPPAVLFDNLPAGSAIESDEIAIALTSGDWEDRKLGISDSVTLPNRAVWCFTGNNVRVRSDLRRRFITVRMEPEGRAHHERKFSRSLTKWAVDNRPQMLIALLNILVWGAKDKTELKDSSGFDEWDREVRRVVIALLGEDPVVSMLKRDEHEAPDDDDEAERSFVKAWVRFVDVQESTTSKFLERVHEAKSSADPTKKHLAVEAEAAVSTLRRKPIARLERSDWGYVLRSLKDKSLEVMGVECKFRVNGTKDGNARWELVGREELANKLGGVF